MKQNVDARTRVAAGQSKQERSGITRARLISATEKLVAEWGIEAVNLRDVGREAEQHNNSVVQYHFGTKEFLVDSVISARLPELDNRYRTLLAQRPTTKKESGTLAKVVVAPIAELAQDDDSKAFVGFLASMLTSRHWRPLLVERPEVVELLDTISTAATSVGVPSERAGSRVQLAWELAVIALAAEQGETDETIDSVTDAVAGIVGVR